MLSFVLLPILRASITPLRTFHQRSLLLSDVNCASISEKYPALSGVFCGSPYQASMRLHRRSSAFRKLCNQAALNRVLVRTLATCLGLSAFLYSLLPIFFCQSGPSADSGGKPMRGKVCGFRRGSGCPLDGRWHYQASLQGRIT